MDRKFKSGASGTPPDLATLVSTGYVTEGDGISIPATTFGAAFFHMVLEEMLSVLTAAGIARDVTSVTQLRDAIIVLASGSVLPAGMAAHDIILAASGAALGRLAKDSTAGKPLLSGGASADPGYGGDADWLGSLMKNAQLQGFVETKQAPAIASNVMAVDYKSGNVVAVALNANITTMTLSNIPTTGKFAQLFFLVTADGSARTWAWLTGTVKWQAGVAPTLTTTNGKLDVFSVWTVDGGTTWYGAIVGQNF